MPAEVRRRLSTSGDYGLMIGGERRQAAESFPAIDPSTGKEWARIADATAGQVGDAVDAAAEGFQHWRRVGPSARQKALLAMADRVDDRAERWSALLPRENGRPVREATSADLPLTAAVLRYYAGLARTQTGITPEPEDAASLVYTLREPLGVIGALIPWNSPLISTALKVGPALAAGNSIVVKPSEFASASVVEFAEAVADVTPPGVVNVVTGAGATAGAALVDHAGVAKLSFTGGPETGRAIMSAAGRHLTPSIMELGGKSAFIVCADADLEAALAYALTGIFLQNGQVCFAASRLLVHEAVYDEFVGNFTDAARSVRVGDALDEATQMGPMVSAAHRDRVLGMVAAGVSEGAEVLAGGGEPDVGAELAGGWFVAPTVVEDPAGGTSLSREEVFGPVVTVQRWLDEEDVLRRANSVRYGLAAGVWTRDLARAHRFARALEAGTVWLNTWFDIALGQPLGGVKDSGFGREMSAETLLEYSASKAVNARLDAARPARWGDRP